MSITGFKLRSERFQGGLLDFLNAGITLLHPCQARLIDLFRVLDLTVHAQLIHFLVKIGLLAFKSEGDLL